MLTRTHGPKSSSFSSKELSNTYLKLLELFLLLTYIIRREEEKEGEREEIGGQPQPEIAYQRANSAGQTSQDRKGRGPRHSCPPSSPAEETDRPTEADSTSVILHPVAGSQLSGNVLSLGVVNYKPLEYLKCKLAV